MFDNHEVFKSVIENSIDLTIVTDAEGRAIYVSPQCKDVIGFDGEDILGKVMPDFIHPEDKAKCKKAWELVMAGEALGQFEYRIIDSNGKTRWLSHSAKYVRMEKENVGIQNIIRNITRQKTTEHALRKSEEKLSAIINKSPIPTSVGGSDGTIISFNEALEKLIGYKRAEIRDIGVWANKLYPDEQYRNFVSKNIEAALAGKEQDTTEFVITCKDKSKKTIDFYTSFFPGGLIIQMIDITERRKAEDALRENEMLFSLLLKHSPIYVFIKDSNMRPLRLSDNYEQMIGMPINEMLGKTMKELFPSDLARKMVADDQNILKTGELVRFEEKLNDRNYETIKFPIFKDGKPDMLAGFTVDITEGKQLEKQLRQSEKMQAIGQLAGGIAHDFNNQLTGIVGYADILREELSNSPKLSHYADNILRATERASDLTSKLLAFARKGKYLSVTIDIHKIIGEAVDMLQRTISKRIVMKQHLEAQQAQTKGDPTQIQNAIMNIALNARDAMPDGGELVIATSIAHLDAEYCKINPYDIKPGNYVQVSVTDNGTGMDETIQKKIFEPFFTTKKQGEGTGMGLASVYGTVKNHGGSINVSSEPGHGTTMNLYLPQISSDAPSEKEPAIQDEPARGSAHLLLVDDEESVLDSTSQLLEISGYKVSICRNGREAVTYYKENWRTIDLVILDMVMPKMGGRETFAEMKKVNPQIRALLSTGYSINGEARQILDEGVMEFIQKPYRRIEIVEKIADILKKV